MSDYNVLFYIASDLTTPQLFPLYFLGDLLLSRVKVFSRLHQTVFIHCRLMILEGGELQLHKQTLNNAPKENTGPGLF